MNIEYDTSAYERERGHEPTGWGRWEFVITIDPAGSRKTVIEGSWEDAINHTRDYSSISPDAIMVAVGAMDDGRYPLLDSKKCREAKCKVKLIGWQ